MDIPADVARRWCQRHDAYFARVPGAAGPLAETFDELHRLAERGGLDVEVTAGLGATARALHREALYAQ